MNIVTPIPTAATLPTANISTEAARRDNILRETIPQTSDAEKGASQKGLGSESDRAKTPGQAPPPVTYERPQIQSAPQSAENATQDRDNGSDQSAGKDDAQEQQRQQAEQKQIESLKARDQEVRAHEQAHAATGGQYAGSPKYEYTTGPDNKRYVTGGEVSIDISEEQTPEQTVRKMQQVRAAALAPAQPSAQDLKVAAEAAQKAFEARVELSEEKRESLASPAENNVESGESESSQAQSGGVASSFAQSFEDIIAEADIGSSDGGDVGTRSLDVEAELDTAVDALMQARKGRIQSAYTQAYTPLSEGFSAQA
ncbi:putative metalloprotease CJM1_0395 family protein [Alteromonas sp. KUL49]|uniref:putative metalloprotease CJM1_0395 family protein n=1 Tax=Alteromonas sp. KUL49 TaxID=2480798 RepID=UPI00102EF6EC|nr:putative metalloprotease CJM1_0395 family protein [Alteromonas sp. KUL49]TAP42173.1 hypothetical protein EYS00_00660 [Alteromonas sp. KUL49]GEA09757.1 hypothetical protein KUL49_01320 [Alteromonas sp. KUL49]